MNKNYKVDTETLEVGGHNLSDHLEWLLATIIYNTVGDNSNAVNSIIYSKYLPRSGSNKLAAGIWGIFYAAARSIVINLEQHFHSALSSVQGVKHMNYSLRVLLLRELLDTCAHEAWHAKVCADKGNWEDDNLDEDGATERAWEASWGIAELYDTNLENFGPILDALILDLYKDIKEDVQEEDCKDWKKLQLHMLENEVNYYNPDTGIEIRTIREVFQAHVQPSTTWIDMDNALFTKFVQFKSVADLVTADAAVAPVISTPTATPVAAPVVAPVVAPVAAPVAASVAAPVATPVAAPTPAVEGYNPLDDTECSMGNPFADDVETPVLSHKAPTPTAIDTNMVAAPVATPVAAVKTQPQMDVLRIQQIAEQVLRRMFHHVQTKCDFNTDGGYNNANAVLDPINISDIDGASELFAQQDTLDENGVFKSHAAINGFIKGLPTAQGLPRYTFYMQMAGQMHKRVFIVQNPNKVKADGTPTSFSTKVKNGNRIMLLVADGAGITADIYLPKGVPLGQEEFNVWNKNK